ncbi:uncharacterized protein F4812DRAFT_23924 [Daldinia caldariorum]|uniref:uncharacterized protein n=1 Tax=Daldinia caldariorum TaxID=326644 RepID=UPI002007EB65|nr:uncharacterized protein F4812DRAFT_23924 [Daldinia caldariorum]KAI1472749.1 hypothetical protein F4812DRAFT_23924 [Daldinia caldariorum]
MHISTVADVIELICCVALNESTRAFFNSPEPRWDQLQHFRGLLPLASYPSSPMRCYHCGLTASPAVTSSSNENGNAGRPYYKCPRTGKFLVFADARGNDPRNPPCECGLSSKRMVAGRKKSRGKLFYVCRNGTCDYNRCCTDARGGKVTIDWEILDHLVHIQII